MNYKNLLIRLLFCLIFTSPAYAGMYDITLSDAMRMVQTQFVGKDVDYYILSDDTIEEWNIFVDAEPLKGWEHECYTIIIPKSSDLPASPKFPLNMTKRTLPPTGSYRKYTFKNRYGSTYNSKPHIAKKTLSNEERKDAQNTYAVILSGGINKISNHERYWNDCSFIYQTLVNKYGIPKDNIFPIMADGDNPSPDMNPIVGDFLDLNHLTLIMTELMIFIMPQHMRM